MVKDTPGVRYCGSLDASPWGNEIIEELAEKALAAENLGKHSATDVLTVSFSANDYVGHAVGPDAPEIRDISRRTDLLIGKLIDAAVKQAGAGNVVTVLTADHGVAPVPEVNQKNKMPGGRINAPAIAAAIQKELSERFGPGQWVIGNSDTSPYLNRELIAKYKTTEAAAENVAAAAVRALPHIYRVYTATQLAAGQISPDFISTAVSNGFYQPRNGNLVILFEPGYLTGSNGTTHGSPFAYDTHVPVIFLGPGIKPGHYYQKIMPNDIAPTLAAIAGVAEPNGAVGRVLQEMWQ
jgi:predicted AlkP superfamily pyrophosphatase or phosphodiesterase